MARYQACLDAVSAAAGKALSEDDLDRVFASLQARTQKRAGPFGDRAAAARQAAAELGSEAKLSAVIEKRNRAINVLRRQALDARAVEGREARSVEAALTGVQHGGANNAKSVDATRHGLFAQLAGPMVAELRRHGLLGVLRGRDKAFDRDVARELWRIRDPEAGAPTGNKHAETVARVLHDAQEAARAMQNDAGAWIGKAEHYVTRQSHDMAKVRGDIRSLRERLAGVKYDANAAFQRWAGDILPRLDPKTFDHLENPEQLGSFLRGTWEALASGVHDTANGAEWLGGFRGPGNLAKRASQERVLHFKSADDWFAYNERYGKGAVVDGILSGLEHAARNTALMRVLGTNPEAMLDGWTRSLIDQAKRRGDFTESDALARSWNGRVLDVLNGRASRPDNLSLAQVGQGLRNVQSLAKLGGVVLSSFPDIAVQAATLRHNGVGLFESYGNAVWSVLRGRGEGEVRDIADLLGVGIEGMLGQIHSRFHAEDGTPGVLSKGVELMHRLNSLAWWTDAHKTGVGLMLSHNLARNAEHPFAELHPRLQSSLERYGMTPADWEAIRTGSQRAADGRAYLTPDTMRQLGADAIDPLIADQVTALRAHFAEHEASVKAADVRDGERVQKRLEKYRADLARERDQLRTAEARRTDATAGEVERLRARVERLAAQVEDAEARADLAGAMSGIDTQQAMRRLLDDVKSGGDRLIERAVRREYAAGEALGRKLRAAEQRVKDAQGKIGNLETAAGTNADAVHATFERRWAERDAELSTFIEDMDRRAGERAQSKPAETAQAATDRDASRTKAKIDRYRAELEQERQKLHDAESKRDAANAGEVARLRALMEREAARIEAAQVRADIEAALRGIKTQDGVRGLIEGVGDWAHETIARDRRRAMTAGERLGRRLQAAEQRIKDAEARIGAVERGAVEAGDAAHVEFEARWQARGDELAAFVAEMNQRATERAHALSEHGDRLDPQIEKLRARKRDELETNLRGYIADQTREAMTEPTAGDRAIATGGTRSGTFWGEAVRMMMQFKQYPVTYWRRSVMREFQRGDGVDAAGLVHLMVATTLLGYVSMTAKDAAKGRDPRQPREAHDYANTVMASMVQGGGLGIMGDFLFGEANRFGGGFLGSMAGPVFGSLESGHQLFQTIRDGVSKHDWNGHDAGAQALALVKNNTPFINLFYTRLALDHLFFYRLQEAINPGYLRRYEARVKKDNNQTFWLSPQSAVR